MATARILIVDDDPTLVQLLTDVFVGTYEIIFASDGHAALYQLAAQKPDLVLLDLVLPDIDGAILLGLIRRHSKVPVIVLSARQEQLDRIQALNAGADDFLAKPFDLDDLEARVEAVLRRTVGVVPLAPEAPPSEYGCGNLRISAAHGPTINGQSFTVTPLLYKLLWILAQHANHVVPREAIEMALWGVNDASLIHLVDLHMSHLRRRLEGLDNAPVIYNVRGRGFVMREAPIER